MLNEGKVRMTAAKLGDESRRQVNYHLVAAPTGLFIVVALPAKRQQQFMTIGSQRDDRHYE